MPIAVYIAISREKPVREFEARLTSECVLVLKEVEPTTPVSTLSFWRGCKSRNAMEWQAGDVQTELNTWLEFDYDSLYVTQVWRAEPTVYTRPVYGLWEGPGTLSSDLATPSPEVWTYQRASWTWNGDLHHAKRNEAHAFGDGECGTYFWHDWFTCGGCVNRFTVSYY